jgi:dihydroxy-acid dehydratase
MSDEKSPVNRRSRNITEGVARAPNRSMYYAMGYEEADFKKTHDWGCQWPFHHHTM